MIKIKRAEFLSALLCKATNDVRYYLNGLCVDSEGFIVATDGHRMFIGKAETDQSTFIFSLKVKPPTKFEYVIVEKDSKQITFFDKHNSSIQSCSIDIIDGRFPDWRRVSDYKEVKISAIGLNIHYLNDAAKAAKYFGKDIALIKLQDSASAVHIELSKDAFMVIMPARI